MDTRTALEREAQRFELPPDAFERLLRRRDRKERNRRISAAVLAIVLTLLSITGLMRAFGNSERPATEPTPTPVDTGIFSEIGGWIVYGDDPFNPLKEGIWAVDPTRPGHPKDQIQLSTARGMPLAWSSDGSRLLIQDYGSYGHRSGRLFVLNNDGTETYLTTIEAPILPGGFFTGGSFSPDGSQVIYPERGSIYVVDSQGGTPRILFTSDRDWVFNPTYSPDGTQIAYSDGIGDNSHQLRVINADGSGTRVLVDVQRSHTMHNIAWFPDGERIMFGLGRSSDIYIVGADGSGLTLVIPDATYSYGSPDGSRISYQPCDAYSHCGLQIADADGTHVVKFGYGGSGPWNPLQPDPEVAQAPAASEGMKLTWTLGVVALLALVAGAVLIRRRMGRLGRSGRSRLTARTQR